MPAPKQTQIQHLLWRAGFGPSATDDKKLNSSPEHVYESMVKASLQQPIPFNVSETLRLELPQDILPGMANSMTDAEARKEKRREVAQQMREGIKTLNLTWLDAMVNNPASLREKVALFWHGHFACRNNNVFFQQALLNTIRVHALASFRDLLLEVSRSAAMLAFLNNQQNRKAKPNENFARELMELFTLGTGNYSEADVKAAARAFTGWGYNVQGEFVFRGNQHDEGEKVFLGKRGNFNGDDILDILLEKKETATFVTRKVYRYFVNETPDEDQVRWLADRFYKSSYDISGLLSDIFTSEWFYTEKNIGTRIKSPVELLVGIRRMLPMQFGNEQVQLLLQRSLGQVLLYPPNVAGWLGGTNWIDSSSLMLRMRMPQLLTGSELLTITPKVDDDVNMGMTDTMVRTPKKIGLPRSFSKKSTVDWQTYTAQFDSIKRLALFAAVEKRILQTPAGALPPEMVNRHVDSSSRERYIQTLTLTFLSTPEYQLC
jgi:uncharacterized protein (DUF1800 family)